MATYTLSVTFDAPDGVTAQDVARAALERVAEWDTGKLLGDFFWRIEEASDSEGALDRIQALLSAQEWSGGTASDIADVVRTTGREVKDSAEYEGE